MNECDHWVPEPVQVDGRPIAACGLDMDRVADRRGDNRRLDIRWTTRASTHFTCRTCDAAAHPRKQDDVTKMVNPVFDGAEEAIGTPITRRPVQLTLTGEMWTKADGTVTYVTRCGAYAPEQLADFHLTVSKMDGREGFEIVRDVPVSTQDSQ